MKIQEIRRACFALLCESGTARPQYSADLIIRTKLGIEQAALLYKNETIPEETVKGIVSLTARRAKGAPLAYVLHEAEFMGHPFKVGKGVLIPRPETELLVEAAAALFPSGKPARFADWCAGSGCIGISLLLENPKLTGLCVDKSPQALRWCAINRRMHKMEARLDLIKNGEPSEASIAPQSLDFITANPPYIPEEEMSGLMREVADYEPRMALDGGAEGLFLFKKFFKAFPHFLKSGGMLLCETAGEAQIRALELLAPPEFVLVNKISDYNGIIRHIIWRKK